MQRAARLGFCGGQVDRLCSSVFQAEVCDTICLCNNQLGTEADAESVLTVRSSVSVPSAKASGMVVPRQRWLTVVDPDTKLIERVHRFVADLSLIPRVSARLDISRLSTRTARYQAVAAL